MIQGRWFKGEDRWVRVKGDEKKKIDIEFFNYKIWL
jgi:hypothetical protein